MEVEFQDYLDVGNVGAFRHIKNSIFEGTSTFLALTVVVFAILLHYLNKSKSEKFKGTSEDDKEYLGFWDLPGPKPIIPTPFHLIGNLPLLLTPLEEILNTGEKLSREFGDIFKGTGLAQKVVVFNSGPTIKALLTSSDFGHLIKAPLAYDLMKPFIVNGLFVSKGALWQKERKILLRSQKYQSLKAYMTMLNKHCGQLVNKLETLFADGKPHQINGSINTSFLRVSSEMITGMDLGDSPEFKSYHQNMNIWKETMAKRITSPWLLLNPIWKLHTLCKTYNQAVNELLEFAKRRIYEHKERREMEERKKRQLDSSSSDLSANESSIDPEKPVFRSVLDELVDAGVDERQIIDEVNTMLFGSHETSAGSLHLLCFALALNQDIQEKARKEIDELFEDPSQFKSGAITYDAVQDLRYVNCCVQEIFRLFPPIFAFGRKLSSPLKFEHQGKIVVVPAGVNAAVSPFLLHRRPDLFPDPYKFDPDRFLPEESAKRHAYSYVPFSAGPRSCIGLKFAMIEMKLMTAYLLRNFEITTTDKMEDIPLLPFTTLTPAKDYTFYFKKRIIS